MTVFYPTSIARIYQQMPYTHQVGWLYQPITLYLYQSELYRMYKPFNDVTVLMIDNQLGTTKKNVLVLRIVAMSSTMKTKICIIIRMNQITHSVHVYPYPDHEVLGPQVWFKGSISRPQCLSVPNVHWSIPVWIILQLTDGIAVYINNTSL